MEPAILEWFKKASQAPIPGPDGASPQGGTQLVPAEIPPVSQATPAPPSQPDSGLQSLMAQYQALTTKYSPDALAAAQARDVADVQDSRFAKTMGNATGLMINNPGAVQFPDAVPLAVKNFLGQRELAKENLGTQMQALQMDPNGPIAQAKLAGYRAAGMPIPQGASPIAADAYVGGFKGGLEPAKTQADIGKVRAETVGAEATAKQTQQGNEPLSPEAQAALTAAGVHGVTDALPSRQAPEVVGPQVTRLEGGANRENAIRLAILELQKWRMQQQAEHPRAVAPGWNYEGPKIGPGESDVNAFLGVYVPGSETLKNLDAYVNHWEKAAKDPRLLASPAFRQEADTLYLSTFPAIARKNAGGTAPPIAEIDSAKEALSAPNITSQIIGTQLPKVRASVARLKQITQRDINEVAQAHFIRPTGGGEQTPGAPRPTRTVNGETREWDGRQWVPAVAR